MANAFDAVEEVRLHSIRDARGEISIADGSTHIPFEIKRVFYIYDVPEGSTRGRHAHLSCRRALIAARGRLRVGLTDGIETREYMLDSPDKALIVPPGLWEELSDFSADALLLVLADEIYRSEDYVRDFNEFLKLTASAPTDE